MSLTILIHRKLPSVWIVRWFLDPKANISYTVGHLNQMSISEFRSSGWDWIRRHFEEYSRIRLSEEEAKPVPEAEAERKLLRDCYAIRIKQEETGELTLIPQTLGKPVLAGLESMGKEYRRTIFKDSPAKVFWETFDEVRSFLNNPHEMVLCPQMWHGVSPALRTMS